MKAAAERAADADVRKEAADADARKGAAAASSIGLEDGRSHTELEHKVLPATFPAVPDFGDEGA